MNFQRNLIWCACFVLTGPLAVDLYAQPGRMQGFGRGPDERFAADRADFQYLLRHRDSIERTVQEIEHGVETVTESDDVDVAERIKRHVAAMYERLEDNRPIHRRDPLFEELFRHADNIELKVHETDRGVRVTEKSTDPYVARLIRAHARVLSLFIENGHEELRKNHELPR